MEYLGYVRGCGISRQRAFEQATTRIIDMCFGSGDNYYRAQFLSEYGKY